MTESVVPTPGQTVGPFFHFALPFERGHQLVPPGTTGALRLHGTVHDGAGDPVTDALVEIRQAGADGHLPRAEGSLCRDHTAFTGWGRAATDAGGRYSFTTVEPGGERPFFSVLVLARGLLDRLFTRAYLPEVDQDDPTLAVVRETDGSLRFDIHLQGPRETTFLTFPGHRR